MSAHTKILVLKAREIIYTLIFAALGIALILLMIYMFSDKSSDKSKTKSNNSSNQVEQTTETSVNNVENANEAVSSNAVITATTTYTPGTYDGILNLGGTILNLHIIVNEQGYAQVIVDDIDDNVKSMYPLLIPALDEMNAQLASGTAVDAITYSPSNKYTSIIILEAVKYILNGSN